MTADIYHMAPCLRLETFFDGPLVGYHHQCIEEVLVIEFVDIMQRLIV